MNNNERIFFANDYASTAHPKLLQALVDTNFVNTIGYGEDRYCNEAKELIKKECNNENVDIFFLVGGTPANMIFISSVLKSYQGVISPDTGHIATHETGSIESRGHKVITLRANKEGKINANQISSYYDKYKNDPNSLHVVEPSGVYISHPTEIGALYTKEELIDINRVCSVNGLFLYVDGARLGYALASEKNEITIPLLAELCDAFYIGGTKCGALLGEALVISNRSYTHDVHYNIKPNGGLLAKGKILGVQFKELFTDNLYISICKNANDFAQEIAKTCKEVGFRMLCDSFTNQQFVIIPKTILKELEKKYEFAIWEQYDSENMIIRICTSWATTKESVEELCLDLKSNRIN
ncbi:MAG: low specificity L-threonine aldolase [Spirochaetaceae bacterium]|nr:low specificity L-threonine aldolase [Spirochaetaceae bacterium]